MSTEPKWTPGPWILEETKLVPSDDGSEHWLAEIVTAGRDRLIASLHNYRYMESKQARDCANAHLIASAPELYEALAKCHDFFVSAGWGREPLSIEVSAALSKARGES